MIKKLTVRQSIPRQIDKGFGAPEEERRVWVSRRGERGLGLPRKREGSGSLEEERGVWNSQGGGKDKCLYFFLYIS